MEKQHLHHLRACWECRFPGTTPELWDQNLHLSKLSRWLVGIVMFQNHQVSKPVSASWKGNTIAFQPFIKHPLYARRIKVGNLRSLSLRSREGNGTPTPVLLPGKSHGRRSLVGWGPWGHEELDTTERLHFHFSLSCIGEGNGNPPQCSCLENPRDGGALVGCCLWGRIESDTTEAT